MIKYFAYLLILFLSNVLIATPQVKIGAKTFTESVILAEILKQKFLSNEIPVHDVDELAGTAFIWNALISGNIDVYAEYSGTILKEIFNDKKITTHSQLEKELDKFDIKMSKPLGFNNSYGLGMLKEKATKYDIKNISDLKNYPDLKIKVTHEFLAREDGLFALNDYYDLKLTNISAIEHSLAFIALKNNEIDITDIYQTEGEIKAFDLIALEDDKHFFPRYDAVYIYKKELEKNCPKCVKTLKELENSISQDRMISMNKQVIIDGNSEKQVAAQFLKLKNIKSQNLSLATWQEIFKRSKEHIFLVGVAIFFAGIAGIILGILSYYFLFFGKFTIALVSLLQTIPSLALLVFMIPFFGIGTLPALVALFLYALLPIVRNTLIGLSTIPKSIIESANVLGLPIFMRLLKIEIPLASRQIIAGLKTSVVITVGTATLGALIGAGGFGNPIITGIRMNDLSLILQGAIPAALMAIFCQFFFSFLEKALVPKGLRLESAGQSTL